MDAQALMETMKSSFLFSFRTGNLVMDTLITGIIIMCSSYLLAIAQKLSSLDMAAMLRWIRYRSSASIVITGHSRLLIQICMPFCPNPLTFETLAYFRTRFEN
jgi:hypothetical protein